MTISSAVLEEYLSPGFQIDKNLSSAIFFSNLRQICSVLMFKSFTTMLLNLACFRMSLKVGKRLKATMFSHVSSRIHE
jgi:hypothetical protein